MPPIQYAATHSLRELRLDVSGWLHSLAFPAQLFFGAEGAAGGDSKGGRAQAPGGARSPEGMPSWYRQKPGYKYHSHDLGPIQGEDTRGRGTADDWNYSTALLRSTWAGHSGRFGPGHGLAAAPVAERYGSRLSR